MVVMAVEDLIALLGDWNTRERYGLVGLTDGFEDCWS